MKRHLLVFAAALTALLVLGLTFGQANGQCYTDPWGNRVCPQVRPTPGYQGAPCPPAPQQAPSESPLHSEPPKFADVSVTVPLGGGRYGKGSGSLVARSASGGTIMLTNNHVVEGSSTVVVTLHTGQQVRGLVVATDSQNDIAAVELPVRVQYAQITSTNPQGSEVTVRAFDGGVHFRPYEGMVGQGNRLTNAYAVGGNSGSGVYLRGKFVGVLWGNQSNRLAFAGVGPVRRLLDRIRARYEVVSITVQSKPQVAPPQQPNAPPPTCPDCQGCNCGPDISALQELHADLLVRVENVERGIGNFPKPDLSTIEQKIDTLEKRVQGISKMQGPPGEDGKDGRDGKDAVIDEDALAERVAQIVLAQIETPQASTDARYYVLVADDGASYWGRLSGELAAAQEGYSKIKVAQPPNYSVGALPQLVEYQSGKPLRTIAGSHDVSTALSYLARGTTP